MNAPTVIVLLVVLVLVIGAIRVMQKGKGGCSCGNNEKREGFSDCANCTVNCPLKRK